MLTLNTISGRKGSRKDTKRLGRGQGSGQGTQGGKGHKGALARSGNKRRPGFEGGQTPIFRRLPKRGFTRLGRLNKLALNVRDLEYYDASTFPEISIESLAKAHKIKGTIDHLTILGTGELTKAFKIKAHKITESAQAKITKAGGQVEIVPVETKKPKKAEKAAADA